MIFPVLRGLLSPAMAPFTYALLALNLFVFAATFETYSRTDAELDQILDDDVFLETQGKAFASMIVRQPERFSGILQKMAERARGGDAVSQQRLGGLALRNHQFMSRAEHFDFQGDEVALDSWKTKFTALKKIQSEHPSYIWGLSQKKEGGLQWFSYQFAHSGALHLFWNMLFLLIFGCFIETTLGGTFVALGYIGGGLVGAWIFSILSGISASPLIGASASVSGLMALVACTWFNKPNRFFYWFLPMRGYFGFASLPTWVICIAFLLPDLSGHLSATRDLGSVAYSAHLGGALWGGILTLMLALGMLVSEVDDEFDSLESPHSEPFDEIDKAG